MGTEDGSFYAIWTLSASREAGYHVLDGTVDRYEKAPRGSAKLPVASERITLLGIRHPEYRRAGSDVLASCSQTSVDSVADLDAQFISHVRLNIRPHPELPF